MARPVRVWTPQAVERLRELSQCHRRSHVARLLGRTYFSVAAKQRELRMLDSDFAGEDDEHRYARVYFVSLRAVRSIGVSVLDSMDDKDRRQILWHRNKAERIRPADPERMMQLAENIARLRRFEERAA